MNPIQLWKRFWKFLKEDTWQSWLVSLVLAFLIIKFIFFPLMSFTFATSLPLVVVESCSMYHSTGFDSWWESNAAYYLNKGIAKNTFEKFLFKGGLNKGDIILVSGRGGYELGDIIIFETDFSQFPLIHRIIEYDDIISTKGDKNPDQLEQEKNIPEDKILGKAIAKVPGLGWVKLIFFEFTKPEGQKGFCR